MWQIIDLARDVVEAIRDFPNENQLQSEAEAIRILALEAEGKL